jgi:hypothetical protein
VGKVGEDVIKAVVKTMNVGVPINVARSSFF